VDAVAGYGSLQLIQQRKILLAAHGQQRGRRMQLPVKPATGRTACREYQDLHRGQRPKRQKADIQKRFVGDQADQHIGDDVGEYNGQAA
jgi:hypothetical protein